MNRQLLWLGLVGLGIVAAPSCGGNLDLPHEPAESSNAGGSGGTGGSSSSSSGMGGSGAGEQHPEGNALFTDGQILGINIKLSPADINALSAAPDVYVMADVDVTMAGTTTTMTDIGVRIKGKAGSLRTLDQKAAFVVKFNEFVKGQKLDGLTKLALNNMVQDSSMIHERLGYLLFNAMDVPSARSGYARVSVNGELYGLYATVESVSNNEFLSRWMGGDEGNLYEGAYGTDLDWGSYQSFDQDNGTNVGFTDVQELITAIDAMTPQNFMTEASKVIDMDRYVEFAATELYIGHWDGYANYRNNFFIYRRPDNNLWTFVPWGIDQTFKDYIEPFSANARLHSLCVQSIDCRKKLGLAYEKVIAKVDELNLIGKATEVKNLIWADVQADPRREYTVDTVSWEIEQTIEFLANRKQNVQDGLACADPTGIDMDKDGALGCGIDCDDNNPNIYPGAPEKCNFIDDDCNGFLDDDPICPQCLIEAAPGGGKYAYCVRTLDWHSAEADCKAQGGQLVSIHNATEQQTIVDRAASLKMGDFWIGFNDELQEDKFVWSDGTPVDFTLWNGGEPNNWGGYEHCTEVHAGAGSWNDLDCGAGRRYVCKLP